VYKRQLLINVYLIIISAYWFAIDQSLNHMGFAIALFSVGLVASGSYTAWYCYRLFGELRALTWESRLVRQTVLSLGALSIVSGLSSLVGCGVFALNS